MSALTQSYSWIVCDGCKAFFEKPGRFSADLRRLAGGTGWKHLRVQYHSSNWLKQVDLCPACADSQAIADDFAAVLG